MPRFHLHLHECGNVIEDTDGIDSEVSQLWAVAIKNARDIMSGEVKRGKLCLSCCIVIKDEQRQEVMRVLFRDALELSGL